MPRSRSLTETERYTVAQWIADHPTWSDHDHAQQLGVTPAQVRYVRGLLKSGKIIVRRARLDTDASVEATMQQQDADALIDQEIHRALAQLAENPDLPATERIGLLGTIARTRRTMQDLRLERWMKTTDAGIVIRIIRRFQANATDEDCIKIYLEERERWASQR